ncbi:hypothetical protein Lgee_0424 [Legionella geestiana]|uniref:Uncharacterized protein n=1 Tax=Legionella geestiana TaxID=45065 RepID=A0A0W0U813_9GAMM|nr:hypothetical protein [Legionella geestiana]KTD03767.1 hypothetical protein Lgee_0424 [Legionella geestiana]QBS11947.1 hypothetical protein E4T54_03830 [Legionella geestiana]QDQ40440.1 hypothetical protein E3226_008595 [Legionella geestiana]STX53340.1 Uncharacterised protein [Legionella geestiana]
MKTNRIICALLACNLVAAPVFASDIVQKLFPKSAMQQAHKAAPSQAARGDFTDFSGNWTGFCAYMGFRFPLDLALVNTASYLRIDGVEYGIGKLDTRATTDTYQSVVNHTAVEWNADMTRIVFRNVALSKENGEPYSHESTAFDLGVNHFTFALEKEALNIRGYTLTLPGLAPADEAADLECTLHRQ